MADPIPVKINCGYARTAIRELTTASKASHRGVVHKGERSSQFQQLFNTPSYELPQTIFDTRGHNWCTFDKNCEAICKMFSKKWHPIERRVEYTTTFCMHKWRDLKDDEKKKHTLSNCKACFLQHESLQKAFPGKPMYTPPPPMITFPKTPNTKQQEKDLGRKVLQELNSIWEDQFDRPITNAIPKIFPESNLTTKESRLKKKQKDRIQKRKIVEQVNKQLAKNATMTVLAEAESLSSYKRKRLPYSFDEPTPPKRFKSHSPNQENLGWDVTTAIETLKNVSPLEKINWSSMARQFNIPQKNGGQVLKEMAQKHGIDTALLEHSRNTCTTPRLRRKKAKLQGGEISMPSLPTTQVIREDRQQLIDSGELSIGEPCSPYILTKSIVNNDGNVESKTVEVCGRKIPLSELRERMLKKHEQYMRLTTPTDIHSLTKEEIITFMKSVNQRVGPNATLEELQFQMKSIQHTRSLAIWHDHSTILQTGYILFAIWVIYDPAVFLTAAEYTAKSGRNVPNLQSFIEEPEIYMIAPSSSSPSDQLALIGDRLECLHDLEASTKASNGVEIWDKLRFFCGDKPAQQFERGTQIGGTYKCGGCGCKDALMPDLSHALRREWRSMATLQSVVTAGKFGDTQNRLKPLDGLKVNELREELQARGVKDTAKKLKPQLQEELSLILEGAQRVPTLLTLNPTQPLSTLNLEDYEVLDCEPLHDLKGHLYNLLPEVPHLLPDPLKQECLQILDTTLPKQKVSGAVLRTAAIKLLLKLCSSSADYLVVMLLETIVRIAQILYMPESRRCPKVLLRLHNCAWLHHELCKQLLTLPRTQKLTHLFGIYLHDLVVHAPQLYQITSPLCKC